MPYLLIAISFGLATGIIARGKGSSFFIWLLIGTVLPILGLVAVILYRSEQDEPERRCPRCNKIVKLYVQVCPRCGTDLYLPDPSESPDAAGEIGASVATENERLATTTLEMLAAQEFEPFLANFDPERDLRPHPRMVRRCSAPRARAARGVHAWHLRAGSGR